MIKSKAGATLFALSFFVFAGSARAQHVFPLDTLHVDVGSRLPAVSAIRAVDVIDRAMIERLPTHTIADAIARALGADVQQRSPAQSDLALRGSTTEQVLVLVDGVPVNDQQTGHFHLDQSVPLEQVERIEVMRGAASSLYGTNAVGGIVNIVTRANGATTSAHIDGGTFNTVTMGAVTGARLRGVAPLTVSVQHDLSDGHRDGTDYHTTIARGSLILPAAGGSLRFDGGDARREFGAAQFYGPFPTSYETTRVLTGSTSYNRNFGRIAIEPRISIRKHYDDFVLRRENPAFYENRHTATDAGGALTVRAPVGPVSVAFGGETYHSTIESTNLKHHEENRSAGYGEVAGGSATGAMVSAGLRFDHSTTFGDFVSPSVGAGYQVMSRLRVRASAARGFRAPTWTDRYYSDPANLGDSTLKVERAWSYEAGAELVPARLWRADVTGFVRQVDNAIDWVKPVGAPASAPFQIINIQEATFRGVEARVDRSDLLGIDWTLRATALSFDAKAVAGLVSKYALRPLTETASLEVSAPLPFGLELGAVASHLRRVGAAPREDCASCSVYHLVDARISYRWRMFDVYAGGTNLGDARYLDVSGVTAPGRALNIGVRWRDPAH
jgi:iron complex outermembrane receptor protein